VKKLIIPLFALFIACAAPRVNWRLSLAEIETPTHTAKPAEPLQFSDDRLTVNWQFNGSSVGLILTNKSDATLRVIWDDAAYIHNGATGRVMHKGVKYIDRDQPQPPTAVAKGATLDDLLVPTDKVQYWSGIGWVTLPLFHVGGVIADQPLAERAQNFKGDKVQILLPIESAGAVHDYLFTFFIDDFEIVK